MADADLQLAVFDDQSGLLWFAALVDLVMVHVVEPLSMTIGCTLMAAVATVSPWLAGQLGHATSHVRGTVGFWWNCNCPAWWPTPTLAVRAEKVPGSDDFSTQLRINRSWLTGALAKQCGRLRSEMPPIVAVEFDCNVSGGFIARMLRVYFKFGEDTTVEERLARGERPLRPVPTSMVIKTLPARAQAWIASASRTNPREAWLYRSQSATRAASGRGTCAHILPGVIGTSESWITGEYVVALEDLGKGVATLAGHIMGNQCFGPVDLDEAVADVSSVQVVEAVYDAWAEVQASYWKDRSRLVDGPDSWWFKDASWIAGRGKASWDAGLARLRSQWKDVRENETLDWPNKHPEMTALLDTSFGSASGWEQRLAVMNANDPNCIFSLTHGDFHPGNALWRHEAVPVLDDVLVRRTTAARKEHLAGRGPAALLAHLTDVSPHARHVRMVDWAEVGVGCPFADLAQFVISHMDHEERRTNERRLVQRHCARLYALGVPAEDLDLERCWERYVAGGIERWAHLIMCLALIDLKGWLPAGALDYFVGNFEAFVRDNADPKKAYPLVTGYSFVF